MTSPTSESTRTESVSRLAYETLEPFHVLAYFNPGLGRAQEDTGLDGHAFYVGARGAPLGPCSPSVVTATFYNFKPELIAKSWATACNVGLEKVHERRNAMLDDSLREILGDAFDDALLDDLASRYTELASRLPLSGRPLAAAWASVPAPDTPRLRLWQAIAVLREWRGDNHIAALVLNGLNGFDAAVFHEAQLPDPTVRRRVMGKRVVLLTRGHSDQDWEDSVDRLVEAGLAERVDDGPVGHRLTARGAAVYDDIEATTDAAGESVWAGSEELLERTRPIVKTVIEAGVLPGTRNR
ncbi:SCO6745 family protein [Gordonia aurantiaca]|uniref:SCO6745 family protein n=1 Tax=Gordonia sp. B21 TaxID=3151852 RepID=UPI003264342D